MYLGDGSVQSHCVLASIQFHCCAPVLRVSGRTECAYVSWLKIFVRGRICTF